MNYSETNLNEVQSYYHKHLLVDLSFYEFCQNGNKLERILEIVRNSNDNIDILNDYLLQVEKYLELFVTSEAKYMRNIDTNVRRHDTFLNNEHRLTARNTVLEITNGKVLMSIKLLVAFEVTANKIFEEITFTPYEYSNIPLISREIFIDYIRKHFTNNPVDREILIDFISEINDILIVDIVKLESLLKNI